MITLHVHVLPRHDIREDPCAELMQQLQTWGERIEKFNNDTIANVEKWPPASLNTRKGILQSHWAKAQNIAEAIMLDFSNNAEVMDTLDQVQEQVIELFSNAQSLIDGRIKHVSQQRLADATPKPADISIARFYGDHAEWPAWRAQFFAKVYDTALKAHEKIDLLAKALKDDAATCVGPMINRDQAELDRAWTALTKRFDNRYQLAMSHLNEILAMKHSKAGCEKSLLKIVDTVNIQTRMIERFEFNTKSWDPILVAIILRKVDSETFREWGKLKTREEIPPLAELMAFLERRIGILKDWNASHPSNSAKEKSKPENHRYHPYDKR